MIQSWLLASRPKTLTAALVPIIVAFCLAEAQASILRPWIIPLALLGAFFIQIATNLFNDAIDFQKGADTDERLGPSRMAHKGRLSVKQLYWAASTLLFLAFLAGIPLVIVGGWPIVGIGLASLFLAYAYTGGPFPLAYLGLGDLFVILFFGLVATPATYYLLMSEWSFPSFVLGFQIGMLSATLIAINNARDYLQDRKVGKMTWAARFGLTFSRFEITGFYLLTFLLNLFWYDFGYVWAAVLSSLALIPAVVVTLGVWKTQPGPIYNSFLGRAAATHLLFGLLFGLGCLLQ